jgi:hypothetical protein
MPYIGRSTDGFGVRNRFIYLASSGDTSVSGADANGATLTFTDGAYVDVYLNGVLLKPTTDYNTSTANTIAGLSALNTNDEVTVVVYDVFTVADMVSATSGGTFSGAVTANSTLDMNGTELILDADGDTSITADTDDQIDFKTGGTDRMSISSEGKLSVTMTSTNTNVESDIGAVHILKNTSSTNNTGSMLCLGSNSNFGTGIYGQLVDNSTNEHKFGIQVRNSSGSSGTRMLIKGDGKVGIGTTTPSVNVHIVEDSTEGTPTYAGATHLAVQASASSGDNCNIAITSGSAGTSRIMFGDKDDEDTGKIEYDNGANDLKFYTNTYERMRFNDNGLIEIMTQNTGSAGAAITFGYATDSFYATTTSSNAEQKKGGFAHFRKGGPLLDQTTNHFCNPRSDGWSMFYCAKLDDGGSDNRYFDFYWNGSSTSSIGKITGNGSNISYGTSSDYRLKENVLDSDLDKLYSQVKSLKVKTYNFKSTPDITQHGFLAHEAKDVWDYVCDLPKDAMKEDVEGGTKDTDGNPAKVPDYQQLDYGKFTPMIMGALQKAMEKIETLEAKVKALEEA